MIDRRIESRPPSPVWFALWLALGLLMLIGGLLADKPDVAIGSALPLCLAAGVRAARPKPFGASFTVEGLHVDGVEEPILYTSMEGLAGEGRPRDPTKPSKRRYPIRLGHEGGVLHIPGRLDVHPDEVYRFLLKLRPEGGSREVHADLHEHVLVNEASFGPERVWTYRAARHMLKAPPKRGLRSISLAALAAASVWIIVGTLMPERSHWAVVGGIGAFYAVLMFAVSFADQTGKPKIKRWRESSLLVSPAGIAMIQGDLRGEMRWEEVRDVKLVDRAIGSDIAAILAFGWLGAALVRGGHAGAGVTHGRIGMIALKVEGGEVLIQDIYDRPIYTIYERIMKYWG